MRHWNKTILKQESLFFLLLLRQHQKLKISSHNLAASSTLVRLAFTQGACKQPLFLFLIEGYWLIQVTVFSLYSINLLNWISPRKKKIK